jgi:hypothetical protein
VPPNSFFVIHVNLFHFFLQLDKSSSAFLAMLIWQDSHFLANQVHNTATITLDPIQSTTLII